MRKSFILIIAATLLLVSCGDGNEPAYGNSSEGALNGTFTVDANGRQVRFSRGNLQYQASTNIWRFADKQYDFIGLDNENMSASYDGWIDLFGWGTGNNPTLDETAKYTAYNSFVDWGKNPIDIWGTERKVHSGFWESAVNKQVTENGTKNELCICLA
ncbi:MAG: hypothetical protein II901_03965 [Paludibacteraceae bacterium]|nr:hypothetical protein [Paludibacteraceae bacterium]MBQ6983747.1 hypothetical protein [Paludibacteraceae bacterium]